MLGPDMWAPKDMVLVPDQGGCGKGLVLHVKTNENGASRGGSMSTNHITVNMEASSVWACQV